MESGGDVYLTPRAKPTQRRNWPGHKGTTHGPRHVGILIDRQGQTVQGGYKVPTPSKHSTGRKHSTGPGASHPTRPSGTDGGAQKQAASEDGGTRVPPAPTGALPAPTGAQAVPLNSRWGEGEAAARTGNKRRRRAIPRGAVLADEGLDLRGA